MISQPSYSSSSCSSVQDQAFAPRIFWIFPGALGLAVAPVFAPVSKRKARFKKITNFLNTFTSWLHNWESRRTLRALDPHMLQDIGVTEFERDKEVNKPFWR